MGYGQYAQCTDMNQFWQRYLSENLIHKLGNQVKSKQVSNSPHLVGTFSLKSRECPPHGNHDQ